MIASQMFGADQYNGVVTDSDGRASPRLEGDDALSLLRYWQSETDRLRVKWSAWIRPAEIALAQSSSADYPVDDTAELWGTLLHAAELLGDGKPKRFKPASGPILRTYMATIVAKAKADEKLRKIPKLLPRLPRLPWVLIAMYLLWRDDNG